MVRLLGVAPSALSDAVPKSYVDTFPGKFQTVIGDGTATTFTVTHGRNSQAVTVQTFSSETSPPGMPTVTLTDVNTVTIVFSRAPLALSIQVVVVG